MQTTANVLYIGSEIFRHPALLPYIRRSIASLGLRTGKELYSRDLDHDLPLVFQQLLEESQALLIVADQQNFPLASRILATLARDTLTLCHDILIPSGASEVRKGSFLYRIDGQTVNLLRADTEEPLPPILLEPSGRAAWHFFPRTEEERERLYETLLPESDHIEQTHLVPGWIRLDAYGEENLGRVEKLLRPWRTRLLRGDSPAEILVRYLGHEHKTVTFAESCTGGRLASFFTGVSGASKIFKGSFVTYSNEIKHRWLGVDREILVRHGAVSRECVEAMASGAREKSGSDIAVSISGIAGPTGAVPGKPVGTVYVCVRNGPACQTRRLQLAGDRNFIQEQTVYHALKMLIESEEKIFGFFPENS